jgi:hypothetical protein
MHDTALILWTLLFGTIGVGFLAYARRQRDGLALAVGAALIGVPYFIGNAYVMVAVGAALVGFPFLVKRLG